MEALEFKKLIEEKYKVKATISKDIKTGYIVFTLKKGYSFTSNNILDLRKIIDNKNLENPNWVSNTYKLLIYVGISEVINKSKNDIKIENLKIRALVDKDSKNQSKGWGSKYSQYRLNRRSLSKRHINRIRSGLSPRLG